MPCYVNLCMYGRNACKYVDIVMCVYGMYVCVHVMYVVLSYVRMSCLYRCKVGMDGINAFMSWQ